MAGLQYEPKRKKKKEGKIKRIKEKKSYQKRKVKYYTPN